MPSLTGTFRGLARRLREPGVDASVDAIGVVATPLARWTQRWRDRLDVEGRDPSVVADELDRVNPLYVPRNHLVESALGAAVSGDLGPFDELVERVTEPFRPVSGADRYAEPAPDSFSAGYQTFCGT